MYMKEVQVWVKVVPGFVRTVGAGDDLWFLGRQPASDASHVHRCTPWRRQPVLFSGPAVTLPAAGRLCPLAGWLLRKQRHVCEHQWRRNGVWAGWAKSRGARVPGKKLIIFPLQ